MPSQMHGWPVVADGFQLSRRQVRAFPYHSHRLNAKNSNSGLANQAALISSMELMDSRRFNVAVDIGTESST